MDRPRGVRKRETHTQRETERKKEVSDGEKKEVCARAHACKKSKTYDKRSMKPILAFDFPILLYERLVRAP